MNIVDTEQRGSVVVIIFKEFINLCNMKREKKQMMIFNEPQNLTIKLKHWFKHVSNTKYLQR